MRKSVFLALLIFIYYIAGMYENPALMVLFLTQLFLIPVMFILSRYLKKHLSVSVEEKTVFAEKDRPFTWTLKAENRGRLPVTRFALRFQIFRKKKRHWNFTPLWTITAHLKEKSNCTENGTNITLNSPTIRTFARKTNS